MQNVLRHPTARIVLGAMAVVVLLAVGAACAKAEPTPTSTPTPRPAPTATPVPAATPTATATPAPRIRTAAGATDWVDQKAKLGGTFRIGDAQPVFGFDSATVQLNRGNAIVSGNHEDKLVRDYDPDPGRGVIGALAQSWAYSADGKVVTFKLRDGVKWHDGQPFTSADVKAHFDAVKNPPTGVPSPFKANFDPVVSFEAPDPLTFRVTTQFAYPQLLGYLSSATMTIRPKHFLDKNNSNLTAIENWPGTGPFKFVRSEGKENLFFEKNRQYWNGDLPILDALEWHTMSPEALGPAVTAGRVDIVRVASAAAVAAMETQPRIYVNWYPGFFDWHFHMNKTKPPFSDVRVRQAIDMVWDREASRQLIESVRIPRSKPGSKWVPKGSGWEADVVGDTWKQQAGFHTPTDAEVARAKQLMKDAGFEKGLGTLQVDVRPDTSPAFIVVAQSLEASINKYLGAGFVKFQFSAEGYQESYPRLLQGQIKDTVMIAFSLGGLDDPYNWLRGFYHSQAGQNYSRFSNAEFDKIVDELAVSQDRKRIVELAKQGIAILDRELPTIPSGIWAPLRDGWWDYVKGSNCEKLILEIKHCLTFDTTWLDK